MTAKNILTSQQAKKCRVALLLIDVINDMDFPEAADLMRHAQPAARCCARLKRRVKALGIPVIELPRERKVKMMTRVFTWIWQFCAVRDSRIGH